MSFLPARVAGQWFYLYLILDLYSRKILGFEVHASDSADHASHLVRRTARPRQWGPRMTGKATLAAAFCVAILTAAQAHAQFPQPDAPRDIEVYFSGATGLLFTASSPPPVDQQRNLKCQQGHNQQTADNGCRQRDDPGQYRAFFDRRVTIPYRQSS